MKTRKYPPMVALTPFHIIHCFRLNPLPSNNPFLLQQLQDTHNDTPLRHIHTVEYTPPNPKASLSPTNSGSLTIHFSADGGPPLVIKNPLQALRYRFLLHPSVFADPFFHTNPLPNLHLQNPGQPPLILPLSFQTPTVIPPSTLNTLLPVLLPNVPPAFLNSLPFSAAINSEPKWELSDKHSPTPVNIRICLSLPTGPVPFSIPDYTAHNLAVPFFSQTIPAHLLLSLVHSYLLEQVLQLSPTHIPLYQLDVSASNTHAPTGAITLSSIPTSTLPRLFSVPVDAEEIYLLNTQTYPSYPSSLNASLTLATKRQLPLINWEDILDQHFYSHLPTTNGISTNDLQSVNLQHVIASILTDLQQRTVQDLTC